MPLGFWFPRSSEPGCGRLAQSLLPLPQPPAPSLSKGCLPWGHPSLPAYALSLLSPSQTVQGCTKAAGYPPESRPRIPGTWGGVWALGMGHDPGSMDHHLWVVGGCLGCWPWGPSCQGLSGLPPSQSTARQCRRCPGAPHTLTGQIAVNQVQLSFHPTKSKAVIIINRCFPTGPLFQC